MVEQDFPKFPTESTQGIPFISTEVFSLIRTELDPLVEQLLVLEGTNQIRRATKRVLEKEVQLGRYIEKVSKRNKGESFYNGAQVFAFSLELLGEKGYKFPEVERETVQRFEREMRQANRSKTWINIGGGARAMPISLEGNEFNNPQPYYFRNENPVLAEWVMRWGTVFSTVEENKERFGITYQMDKEIRAMMGAATVYDLKRRQANSNALNAGHFSN